MAALPFCPHPLVAGSSDRKAPVPLKRGFLLPAPLAGTVGTSPGTAVGHNAGMTLFDVSELAEPTLAPGAAPPPAPATAPATLQVVPAPHGAPDDALEEESGPQALPAPEIEVRISRRRKKTSEARWVGDRIVVSLPAHLDVASRQKTIDWLVERLLTRHRPHAGMSDGELLARAVALSKRYLVGTRPASVRWVTNMTARWGSCSHHSGEIRISHRLRNVPGWVLDSVLVHEVAHLTHPDHSPAFHRLADRYPRHEEAGTFLAGYGLGLASSGSEDRSSPGRS
jgi:predicted metal-dependent hydrolase